MRDTNASPIMWRMSAWKKEALPAGLKAAGAIARVPGNLLDDIAVHYGEGDLKSLLGLLGCHTCIEEPLFSWNSAAELCLFFDAEPGTGIAAYDECLRVWYVTLESLHAALCNMPLQYTAASLCRDGRWENGISISPPKFTDVAEMLKAYYHDLYAKARKVYKFRNEESSVEAVYGCLPVQFQVKVHQACIYFKNQAGPGIVPNPAYCTPGTATLRLDLTPADLTKMEFTTEVEVGNGSVGKLTAILGRIYVIPYMPSGFTKFNIDLKDEDDGYHAFKYAHAALQGFGTWTHTPFVASDYMPPPPGGEGLDVQIVTRTGEPHALAATGLGSFATQ